MPNVYNNHEISDKLRQARTDFFDKGYVILDNILDDPLIFNINNSIGEFPGRKHNEYMNNIHINKVATHPTVDKILTYFYNDIPTIFQTINFTYGTQQTEHTDLIYFRPALNKLPYMCGVWCALEDITVEKGPLIFYPHSHKEEYIVNLDKFGSFDNYTKHLKDIADRKYTRTNATIKKGSILIWHSNLIHGGHPNRKQDLTRKSMVTHYFFKSAPYVLSPVQEFNNKKGRD
jgi:ectoine hydroxylase-related dioxygenase (phytanoyl-CoA dioxygenase family)